MRICVESHPPGIPPRQPSGPTGTPKPVHRIDREVILRGLSRLFAGEHKGLHPKTAALIMEAAITGQSGRLDASDADCVVQIGLFGEVVYG